ncbi:MAG TPA: hypothetical protein P5270_05390 [Victivallales bacterium]|nr:hypothetical protein [Victivallales bacterium]HPO90149.1 hypothetical protein [Victivallales bacterium]HRR28778.1 hypothetical protein [Victivallales bacterium]
MRNFGAFGGCGDKEILQFRARTTGDSSRLSKIRRLDSENIGTGT